MESAWVDFKEVKAAISIEMVLAHYNVKLRRVSRDSLRGSCPLPTHSAKGEQSFCVNVTKNIWSCLSSSCVQARNGKRGGNVLDLVSVIDGCSIRDAALKLAHWFKVASSGEKNYPSPEKEQPQALEKRVAETEKKVDSPKASGGGNKPLGFVLKGIDHDHPYLAARGITPETAAHFDVGFFSGKGSMHSRIVIPISNKDGELVAYAGRAIDASEPKYKFPSGFLKAHELWNLHRVAGKNTVVVVEGFFDCMRVSAAGWPCVALMGASMSEEQEKLLVDHFLAVWLMLDGDDAGRGAAPGIVERLVSKLFIRVVALPDGKQPDMLNADELGSYLKKVSQ